MVFKVKVRIRFRGLVGMVMVWVRSRGIKDLTMIEVQR